MRPNPLRVLVAGGSGFIGSHLVRSLLADGHSVAVLTRSPERAALPDGVRPVGWDGARVGDWAAELERSDAVVQLAGASIAGVRWTEGKKRAIRSSRVDSSRALALGFAEVQARPEVLVQGSAVGYYGSTGSRVVTEEAPAGEDFLGRVGEQWEAASAPVEELGVRRAVARSGVVLDREEGLLAVMGLPFRLFVGGPVASGELFLSWIHREDEVRALRLLLEDPRAEGPFNLAAPEPVTNGRFSAELARALGRPSWLRAPRLPLRLALGEMADLLLHGQRAVPERLTELGFVFRYPALPEALADLYGDPG